jgi:methionine synthase II (cobalamin-independent)
VTASTLPILPTTVVGSYAIPAWLWAAYEKIEAGGFGAMDVAETENDAVATAIRDQEHAGVDVISDGEMRRQGFIVSIFKYFNGLRPIEPRRKVGVLSYDGHVFYEPVERISAPAGLGHAQGARLHPDGDDAPVQDHAARAAHPGDADHEGRTVQGPDRDRR